MNQASKIDQLSKINGRKLVIFAVIFYILLFGFISLWKYYNFNYNAMDLAIINQVFYNSSAGDFFASSIHPPTYLGDHVTPILFLLLPFYFLFQAPQTLLILQTVILALCAWPIYLIAKKVLSKNWALVLALAWLINPIVQNANLFEFHFLPFAVFFIFWAFYFYQNKKFWPFIIFCFLALLVREDVSFVIFMFGVVAFWQKRKINWWLTPLFLSVIYFLAALKIADFFAPQNQYKFLIYYSWLGSTPADMLKNLFLKPWLLAAYLFRPENWLFFLGLILPVVFLPLFNPFYLLLGLGNFVQLTLGASGGSDLLLETHYSSLLLPAIFISAVYSLKLIIENKKSGKVITLIKKNKNLALLILTVGLIYSSLTLGPIIGSLKLIFQNGLTSEYTLNKQEFVKMIPQDVPVATTYEFLTPLSSRTDVYSFNYIFLGKQQFLTQDYSLPQDTEYLLIDFNDLLTYKLQYGSNPFYQKQYQISRFNLAKILNGFGLVKIKDNLALFQKNAQESVALVSEAPSLSGQTSRIINDQITFLGSRAENGQYQFWWEVMALPEQYFLKVMFADGLSEYYPFGYGLLGAEHVGKKIQTNYWFADAPRKIELVDVKSGGIEVSADRSTKNVIDEEKTLGVIFSL